MFQNLMELIPQLCHILQDAKMRQLAEHRLQTLALTPCFLSDDVDQSNSACHTRLSGVMFLTTTTIGSLAQPRFRFYSRPRTVWTMFVLCCAV